jgi:hypothetical protein
LKRFTISSTGSTSSMGIGSAAYFISISARKVAIRSDWSSMSFVYSLKVA